MNSPGPSRRAENVLGIIGCAGLLVGVPAAFFLGRFTDWRVLAALAVFVLLIVAAFKASSRVDEQVRQKRNEDVLSKLRPGVWFKAHGSAGSPMEGRVVRIIDDNTIEAYVGYADGGPKEQGPFPISNIDSVGDDD